jgi:hypothetical protein
MCHSSFQHPPDRPAFRCIDWAKLQTHMESGVPFNPELHNALSIDMYVENFSGTVLRAVTASAPKCHPRDDPQPLISAGIQD